MFNLFYLAYQKAQILQDKNKRKTVLMKREKFSSNDFI
ncbi:hypothetical protein BPA_0900028 (plasmid) [Borrelia parkeri SLO]|uniref:Uncharacterized protein n=1 Tax=Borrelia parkeri SLO TaxID=1313294 RepID=W5STV1_BORPR|nr:hypothetical protein BPA_0900028 [Borrelia parkeri SLO]